MARESPPDRPLVKPSNQCANGSREVAGCGSSWKPQHDDSGKLGRPEQQGVPRLKVQRDQAAPFGVARFDEASVADTLQALVGHCGHVVAGLPEEVCPPVTEVFVEFEFQLASVGISTYRSRAISAP